MDLATRAFSPAVQDLLVELLNEANKEVKEAHEAAQAAASSGAPLTTSLPAADPSSSQPGEDQPSTPTSPQNSVDEPTSSRFRARPQIQVSKPPSSPPESGSEDSDSDYQTSSSEDEEDATSDVSDQTSSADSDSDQNEDDPLNLENLAEALMKTNSLKELKKRFAKLDRQVQEDFHQDTMSTEFLLSLDPNKKYAIADLDSKIHLERALRLLFLAKFGRDQMYHRINPHIQYNLLSNTAVQAIEKKLSLEEEQVKHACALLKTTHL